MRKIDNITYDFATLTYSQDYIEEHYKEQVKRFMNVLSTIDFVLYPCYFNINFVYHWRTGLVADIKISIKQEIIDIDFNLANLTIYHNGVIPMFFRELIMMNIDNL